MTNLQLAFRTQLWNAAEIVDSSSGEKFQAGSWSRDRSNWTLSYRRPRTGARAMVLAGRTTTRPHSLRLRCRRIASRSAISSISIA